VKETSFKSGVKGRGSDRRWEWRWWLWWRDMWYSIFCVVQI